jgi:hypothetical protein
LVRLGAVFHGAEELVGQRLHDQRDLGLVLGEGGRGGDGAQQRERGGALQGAAGELHGVSPEVVEQYAGLCRAFDIT